MVSFNISRLVRQFRRWVRYNAGGGFPWPDGKSDDNTQFIPKEDLFDVFKAHTCTCSICKRALQNLKIARVFLCGALGLSLVEGKSGLQYSVLIAEQCLDRDNRQLAGILSIPITLVTVLIHSHKFCSQHSTSSLIWKYGFVRFHSGTDQVYHGYCSKPLDLKERGAQYP